MTGHQSDDSLIYARPSGASRAILIVAADAAAIRRAEAAGWVAPDPDTFARRTAILEAEDASEVTGVTIRPISASPEPVTPARSTVALGAKRMTRKEPYDAT